MKALERIAQAVARKHAFKKQPLWLDLAAASIKPGKEGLVTVITSFLNGEQFFDDAAQSVFDQTYENWEWLLIDDGSSDASRVQAQRLTKRFPKRVRYMHHTKHANKGAAASRNVGLAHARGEYITFLDIDDVFLPEKLSRQLAILLEHPDIGMVYGPLVFWYSWTGRPEDESRDFVCRLGEHHDVVISPPAALHRQLTMRDGLPGVCSVLIRRKPALMFGGFTLDSSIYEDEAYFSQIVAHYPVYLMSDSLDLYRQHSGSRCAAAIAAGAYIMDPSVPNMERKKYLEWLAVQHFTRSNNVIMEAVQQQLRAYGE